MYLMRIGPAGAERPVDRIDDDTYVDMSDVVSDFDESFFASGLNALRDVVAERVADRRTSAFAGERIGAAIARPHQILCIGLNYSDHAAETDQAVLEEPIVFNKAPNTLVVLERGDLLDTGTPPGVEWVQTADLAASRR